MPPEPAVAEPPVETPAASTAAAPEPQFTNFSDDLDAIGASEHSDATPDPTPPPTKPAAPAKPDASKDAAKATPPAAKPATKPASAATPAKTDDKVPQKTPELRAAYDRVKAEAEQLRAELAQAKADGASKKELEAIRAEHAAAIKEKQDLADELRFANYERSPEYKNTHLEPLNKAFVAAYQAMDELTVTQEDGTERKATPDDFNSLINLPLGQAVKQAKALFGDASAEALAHRSKILELERNRKEALSSWKTKSADRETQTKTQQEQFVTQTKERFNSYIKTVSEKHAELYAPSQAGEDGVSMDPEGDALLEKGSELADKAFGNYQLKPGEKPMTHQDLIDLQADMRLRAAAFGRQVLRVNRLTAENKALKAKIEALEKEPGPGGKPTGEPRDRGTATSWEDQSDAEIEALAEQR